MRLSPGGLPPAQQSADRKGPLGRFLFYYANHRKPHLAPLLPAASLFLPSGYQLRRRSKSVSTNENDRAGCSRLTARVLYKHLTECSQLGISLKTISGHFPKNARGNIKGKVLRSSSEALWEKPTLNQTLEHGSQFLGFM